MIGDDVLCLCGSANVTAVRDEPVKAISVHVSLTLPTITETSLSNYALPFHHAPVLRQIVYSNERNVPKFCF